MSNSINVEKINEFRFTNFDEGEVRKDKILTARIIKVHWEIGKGSTPNGLEYWQATVEADLPNGSRRGPALLWDKLLFSEENLNEGSEIILAIICSGEDSGNAIIEIPDFHIKFKELHDNGFKEIELFEEGSTVDSEEEVLQEAEDVDQEIFIKNRAYENTINEKENNYEVISEETESISDDAQQERGFGKTVFIFIISFIFIGAILSPLSFLGFILFPIWLGSTFLITNFILKTFILTGTKK